MFVRLLFVAQIVVTIEVISMGEVNRVRRTAEKLRGTHVKNKNKKESAQNRDESPASRVLTRPSKKRTPQIKSRRRRDFDGYLT